MGDAADILVLETSLARIARRGRHVHAVFKVPLQTISTCARNGGQRSDLTGVINHQSCEGARHDVQAAFILGLGPEGYQSHVCRELGVDDQTTAVMGTAAAMQYLGVAERRFEDLSVAAVVTAGVQGNAACAGDPARYDERGGRWVNVGPAAPVAPGAHHGTINTLVLIDSALTPAALARAVVTASEAKSAALQRLAVGSKTSRHLATGTGTDQYALCSRLPEPACRSWSGHHTKLGELIALAVIDATLEALRWQNGLEPSLTRSLAHALGRFGVTEPLLRQAVLAATPEGRRPFVEANFMGLLHEPQASAGAYALAAVLDRVAAGTLSELSAGEAILNQLALIAEGQSAQSLSQPEARRRLLAKRAAGWSEASLLEGLTAALLTGFEAKWEAGAV